MVMKRQVTSKPDRPPVQGAFSVCSLLKKDYFAEYPSIRPTMRILYFNCLILLLITGSGCTLVSDPIPHLWFFTYTQGGETDSLLTPASFLELRKDGTYTRDFGRFDYGKWVYKDKILYLHNHCQFWETYFTWALKNELATIDVRSTPTAIKIYGNTTYGRNMASVTSL
jgi:hypothetical protein